MTNFVGDHVGLGELASFVARTGAELVLQIVEERGVEIDARVARAIERAHGGAGERAGRRLGTGKQSQFRRMISPPGGRKDFRPLIFGLAQYGGDELPGGIVGRAGVYIRSGARLLRSRAAAKDLLCPVKQQAWVNAEIPADQRDNNHHADAKATAASGNTAGCARLAIV